jgi:hypothetical protein
MRYAATVLALLASLATSGSALADPPRDAQPLQVDDAAKVAMVAEVIVLHGTNSGEGIDPKIGELKQLKEPPFSAYDSYKLLERTNMPLELAKEAALKLPNEGKFTLKLQEILKPKKKDEAKRYVLEASIAKPDGKPFLPALTVNAQPNEIFFIAGQKYKKGILVLGIRVTPKAAD